ncbi:hypothetical protein L873DRAFT_1806413 [Choiromyces venosus 120613-1]|uniref:Myb-like domain-containing protein n=1 Tax=Choiromyces venosus 120613-1 TaxID=1336337 RepID=A0A3N4JMT2_9PEZI|nr:hypothetical protein L873DRAFT_1806413 [Choiromyces venosus 120613-1]
MPPWTDADRSLLLLTIIEFLAPSRPTRMPWDGIAQKMGTGYTPEAIRQQYNKLRRSVNSSVPARARNHALDNVNKTPAKRVHEEIVRREDDLEDDEYRDEEGETIVVNGKRFKVEGISDDERIIKTERVDDEGVIRLDDDDFYL